MAHLKEPYQFSCCLNVAEPRNCGDLQRRVVQSTDMISASTDCSKWSILMLGFHVLSQTRGACRNQDTRRLEWIFRVELCIPREECWLRNWGESKNWAGIADASLKTRLDWTRNFPGHFRTTKREIIEFYYLKSLWIGRNHTKVKGIKLRGIFMNNN